MNVVLTDVAIVIALAVLVGFYVSWRASRLDRLHARAETTHAAIEAAAHQVFLARNFYNDAVAATLAARRRRLVRLLRLAGGAPAPVFFEIDDAPPLIGDGSDGADMPRLTG